MNRIWHRRLPDWEAFDEINLRVVPRYKTSGLSGDEWRQHIEIELKHKGEVVISVGAGDMQSAILMLGSHLLKNSSPIPDRVIEIEKGSCDQPSCRAPAVGRYLLKRLTGANGEWLDMNHQSLHYYRQFCTVHARRGDCSREDCDENYEPMDELRPSDTTNIHESPSAFGGVVVVEDIKDPGAQS